MYERAKTRLLTDAGVCEANRTLFFEFFIYEERKLKRQNRLPDLDEGCCKTLYAYTMRFRNVNEWFGNKPWRDLTKEDIQRVYDALEDGRIRTKAGKAFLDRNSYYNKIMRSKPFRLAGKTELVRDVIEFSTEPKRIVRYITEEHFRRLVSVVANPHHLLLFWLAWDIGENIYSLLQLSTKDFTRQANRDTGEPEYLVHLPQAKLKRSRLSRSEVTVYPETTRYIDIVLARTFSDDGRIFPFGYRSALEAMHRAGEKGNATTEPNDERVRWKDLRSGMACHLLRCGWTRDEVNARLGHTPRSAALDAYINFLALDREAPKRRMRDPKTIAREAIAPQMTPSPPTPTPVALAPTVPPVEPASPGAQVTAPRTAPAFDALLALRDELLSRLDDVAHALGVAGHSVPPTRGKTLNSPN